MASLTITIPDAQAARVVNKFALRMGYQTTINGQPNPENKTQFLKRKIIDYVTSIVRQQELDEADLAARQSLVDPGMS